MNTKDTNQENIFNVSEKSLKKYKVGQKIDAAIAYSLILFTLCVLSCVMFFMTYGFFMFIKHIS